LDSLRPLRSLRLKAVVVFQRIKKAFHRKVRKDRKENGLITRSSQMRKSCRLVAWLTIIWSLAASAQSTAAPTPPMGWNSWDSYGTTVREEQVKANADAMSRDLASHGWGYIVVDIQWYEPNAQGHDYAPGAKLAMDQYA